MGSWPAATTHAAVHPHQMVLLEYNRNSCDLCGGPLVGKLGYRCEPCDFDVHCTCLPSRTAAAGSSTRSSAPPHNAHAHPPPPRVPPRPSYSYPWHAHVQPHHYAAQPSVIYATPRPPPATGRPQLNLSLSEQFSHQLGAQTSPVSPAPSNHGYYHHRPRPADYGAGAPYRSYDHLQQQNYPTTYNQQGGGYDVPDQQSFDYLQQQNYPYPTAAYQHDYTGTRESGDADDYDPLDGMDDY